MAYFEVYGGRPLSGEITPQGAKNEALQIICATLLTKERVVLHNVPEIVDVLALVELLRNLGVEDKKVITIFNKQDIYREKIANGEVEADEEEFEGENSYNKWFFQYISYIGEDYVSLVYCEITGMGGPNEYNTLEAYTIDCTTGNILTASEILGIQNDAALRCQISDKMGTEQFLTWDELGYYITDKAIVFFGKEFWMRGTYEDVIVWR